MFRLALLILIANIVLVSFTTENENCLHAKVTRTGNLDYTVPEIHEIKKDTTVLFIAPKLGNSYLGFKEAVAFKESSGRYDVVNEYGYMGKYQFGKGTLAMIGLKGRNDFLSSPELQEKAFYANLSRNKWILRREIKSLAGRKMNGIKVTESGILAAAHLAGPGAVKKYLRKGGVSNFADAFGTTIQAYMKRFAGYDISVVVANRKAKA